MDNTLESRAAQAWRRAGLGPTPGERLILGEIDRRGGLRITYVRGRRVASCADGTPISRLRPLDLDQAAELGWLVTDPLSPGLLPDVPPQKYTVNQRFSGGC